VKFQEVPFEGETFQPFSVRVDISTKDELHALTNAIGGICNGHGLDLYDFLRDKCQEYGVKL
jgi:hypothetical protein